MPRSSKKLEKLLDERQTIEAEGRVFNEDMFKMIKEKLQKWDSPDDPEKSDLNEYHPLVELAKVAVNPAEDKSLRVKCNMEIASYMYPKVKSYEIQKNVDKTVNVNIKIANYAAKKDDAIEIEAEELSGEKEANSLDSMIQKMID